MTGKELMDWITDNKLEKAEIILDGLQGYETIVAVWEGEQNGGAIMLESDRTMKNGR